MNHLFALSSVCLVEKIGLAEMAEQECCGDIEWCWTVLHRVRLVLDGGLCFDGGETEV